MADHQDTHEATALTGDESVSLLRAFYASRSRENLKNAVNDLRIFMRFCGCETEPQVVRLLFNGQQHNANSIAQRYRDHLQSSGLAYGTVKRRLSVVRELGRVAKDRGDIAWRIDVTASPRKSTRDTRGASKKAVARAEASRQHLDATSRRNRAITFLVHELNLTRAELVGLDLSDYDPNPKTPTVTISRNDDRSPHPITIKVKRAIDAWLEERAFLTGPLFCQVNDGHVQSTERLDHEALLPLVRAEPRPTKKS